MRVTDRRSRAVPRWLLCLTVVFVVLFVGSVRVRYTDSDPRGSLLVSAAIIEHGDIKPDAYAAAVEGYGKAVVRRDGHIYYFFPLGTALSSVPFVYVFLKAGYDLTNQANEATAQIVIAAFVAVLTVWLLYVLARHYLSDWVSWALAVTFWLSTPLVSTNATALWSHDFACLYALIAIDLMLTWRDRSDGAWWRGGIIAAVLVMAYLCRPTLSLLGILSVIAVAWSNRHLAAWMSGFGSAFVALFVLFSLREFAQVLPNYYLPRRLRARPHFRGSYLEALVGNLVSPSRGLLVFCPFLIVAVLYLAKLVRHVKEHAFVLVLGLVWPITHWIVVSTFHLDQRVARMFQSVHGRMERRSERRKISAVSLRLALPTVPARCASARRAEAGASSHAPGVTGCRAFRDFEGARSIWKTARVGTMPDRCGSCSRCRSS